MDENEMSEDEQYHQSLCSESTTLTHHQTKTTTTWRKIKDRLKQIYNASLTGLLFSAFSGLCFTMSNFMVQVTTLSLHRKTSLNISSVQMVIARCLVQLCFVLPFIVIFKIKFYDKIKDLLCIIPMGVAGFVNIVFIYLSLERLPISDTLLITFTSPFFCGIFSKLILNEGLHWINSLAGLLSFVGVTIVARPTFIFGGAQQPRATLTKIKHPAESEYVYLLGVFYALLGAFFLALYFVLVRKLVLYNKTHIAMTVFYPSLFGTIFTYLLMLAQGMPVYLPKSFEDLMLMSSIGIYSMAALLFLTLALKMQNATVVNLIRNLDVVYAFLLQYIVFNIKPNPWNISGGLVIIAATAIVVLRQFYQNKQSMKKEEEHHNKEEESSNEWLNTN